MKSALLARARCVALLLLTSCGARSSLEDVGGATMGSTSCALPVVTLPGARATSPNVVAPSDDQAVVIYVDKEQATRATAMFLGFDPWGVWPPDLSDLHTSKIHPSSDAAAQTLRTGDFVGSSTSRLSAVYEEDNGEFDYAALRVSANGKASAPGIGSMPRGAPLFVGAEQPGGFAGVSVADGSDYALHIGVGDTGEGESGGPELACATTPIQAALVRQSKGWTMALAAGTQLGASNAYDGCPNDFPDAGPSKDIQLAHFYNNVDMYEDIVFHLGMDTLPGISTSDVVTSITSANISETSPQGGWLAWTTEGTTDISLARLDAQGAVVGAASFTPEVAPKSPEQVAIAAAPEDRVIVAVARTDANGDDIDVTLVDETGAPRWSARLATKGAVELRPNVLLSPGGHALLLVWQERDGDRHHVKMARMDCVDVD